MPPRAARRGPAAAEFAGPNKDERWWQSDDSAEEEEDSSASTRTKGATASTSAARPPSSEPAEAQAQEEGAFYDPEVDDRDAKWADKARSGRVSDAILSCPGCFSTLTVDCQQHARHHNQFRAMLVMNCSVDTHRPMQAAPEGSHGQGRKKGGKKARAGAEGSAEQQQQQEQEAGAGAVEQFHPVSCSLCGTEVGVQGADEVYHFFHVFPSNA